MRRTGSSLSTGSSQPADTPHSTFSSIGSNLSWLPGRSSTETALYGLGHGLVPIINDPSVQSHLNPLWCWPFGNASDSFTTPPAQMHGVVYEVTLQDFRRYMRVMADKYDRFESNLQSLALDSSTTTPKAVTGELHGQGEGLAQAMTQVPLQYFTEEFDLTRRETWQHICPSEQDEERQEVMEQLAGYLDIVETHLLRDIAARSENFFQAANVVQDLRGVLARSYVQVKALRHDVHTLDEEVLEAAVTIQKLQRRRSNLKGLVHKLQAIEQVVHSQHALQLLLPQGDFAGALEIMADIQLSLQRDSLQHLHCFRHMPQQLAQAEEVVQDLMASNLLDLLRFQALPQLQDHILAAIMQQQEYSASRQASVEGEYRLQSDDGSTNERQAGLTVANGSHDGLASLLEAASDSLQQQPEQLDQLTEMATPLVLGLRKTNSLVGVLKNFKEAAAMEVKQGIRDAVEQTLPTLLGDKWTALQHHSLAEKLQAASPQGFMQLLAAVLCVTGACLQHCSRMKSLIEEGLRAGRTPRTQWGPLLEHMQEAAQAVSEVANSRWAKLLGSRTAETNQAPLAELKSLLELCHAFGSMTESFGCRSSLALRNAMQLQDKAYLDHLHHTTLASLTGHLEQEVWASVPVPAASQAIVDNWLQQAATLKVQRPQASPTPSHPSSRSASDTGESGTDLQQHPLQDFTRPSTPPNNPPASTSGRPPTPPAASHHANGRHESNKLHVSGQSYHVAHTVLLLLRMHQTYLGFRDAVPLLAAETARRAADLLKVFNSRMCQLVLGAGAMQVSGLRSITAKHLALSSQCLSAFMALHPVLKSLFTSKLPTTQRGLLLPELDKLFQDLSMHKDEIHSKLVGIMRERLSTSLKQLPAIASSWEAQQICDPAHVAPSSFAQTNAKQLRVLSQVLSPILSQADVHSIFGRVAALFSKSLTDAFSRLEPRGMSWEAQCGADVRHLLYTLEQLPMDKAQAASNVQPLTTLCITRFAGVASHATANTGSPKSLHRSITDIDAARRRQPGAASPSENAPGNGTAHPLQNPIVQFEQHAGSRQIDSKMQQQTSAAPDMQLRDLDALGSASSLADSPTGAQPLPSHVADSGSQRALTTREPLLEESSQQGLLSEAASLSRAVSESSDVALMQSPAQPLATDTEDQLGDSTRLHEEAEILQSAAEESSITTHKVDIGAMDIMSGASVTSLGYNADAE